MVAPIDPPTGEDLKFSRVDQIRRMPAGSEFHGSGPAR
jgi:hypothetical protein